MENQKRILILGSGMMVEPLIDYLQKRENNFITVASNDYSTIKNLIEKRKGKNISGAEINVVNDTQNLENLISQHELVVSYVPPFLHEYVAKACLNQKRNMITTSYVSPFLKQLESKVKEAGLIFMNEIGLDPGIDHLISHKVIHEAQKRGEKLVHFESWCGALASPEFVDNPLLYKFSWSPRGALIALRNDAQQLINGKTVKIPSKELLMNTTNKQFHPCFNLEGYFNRDSLPYKEVYNLKDAHTIIRGTIRYKGCSFIFQAFKNLGLFADDKFDEKITNWRDHFINLINKNKNIIDKFNKKFIKKELNLTDESKTKTSDLFFQDSKERKFYLDITSLAMSRVDENFIKNCDFNTLFNSIFSSLQFLAFYDENNKVILY